MYYAVGPEHLSYTEILWDDVFMSALLLILWLCISYMPSALISYFCHL